jgi:5-methylcytosine-specific restriction endonuclease McrA
MEIKPDNKHIKPAEFKQIRELVLKRAHNRCEFCGVSNGLCITEGHGWYPVVLSIAHLDCDTTNNDPSNLRALCQRCFRKFDSRTSESAKVKEKSHTDKTLEIPFED